jgi:deoxyribodipyrimidine photolyase
VFRPVEVSLTLHAHADVCSNWGNWCAAAGMTGGRVNKFNITKQSKARCPVMR